MFIVAQKAQTHLCRLKDLGQFVTSRSVSSHYVRPHPRPYKRRLFEATLAPILPPDLEKEQKHLTENKLYSLVDFTPTDPLEMNPMELFLADQLRKHIIDEGFRLVVICQLLGVKQSRLWLARNQLRIKGLELCTSRRRIIQKAFESTPLRTLNLAMYDTTCLLFGKDLQSIKTVFSETASRYRWLVPLVVAFDDRILSLPQAKQLGKMKNVENLRVQTTQILAQIRQQLVRTLQHQLQEVTQTLDSHQQVNNSNEAN